MVPLDRPIILLGAPRSGTSLLGNLLRQHPDVCYWMEPRTVWMHGNAYRGHDELTADDATPRVRRYIERRFAARARAAGRPRFAEKTPSNSLRVRFVHAVFPDCRMIHIIRDGRDAVPSAMLRAARTGPGRPLRTRLRETPVHEWPAYAPTFFRTLWRTGVLRRPATYWGPQPAEWRDWIELPPHVRLAKQWSACVRAATRDGRGLPPTSYMELRYEELLGDPAGHLERVLAFAELPPSAGALDHARRYVDPDRPRPGRGLLTAAQSAEVAAEMQPLLAELGYA